jgi:hypothetical protein
MKMFNTVLCSPNIVFANFVIESKIIKNAAFFEWTFAEPPEIEIIEVAFAGYTGSFNNFRDMNGSTTAHQIGKTTFLVTTSFNGSASETLGNMLVRYVANQISNDIKTRKDKIKCLNK